MIRNVTSTDNGRRCPEPSTEDFEDVFEVELDEEIGTRRVKANLRDKDDVSSPRTDLVGLALSGGGIRSAIFNLGILQAFSHRGLLRYVDYISSVSGGGYIAGYLAGLTAKTRIDDSKSFHDSEAAALGCHPRTQKPISKEEAAPKQTEHYRFEFAGGYLHDTLSWAWRYFAHTTLMLSFFASVTFAMATLMAILWREMDGRWVRDYFVFFDIGYTGNELTIAFFYSLIMLVILTCVLAVYAALVALDNRPARFLRQLSGPRGKLVKLALRRETWIGVPIFGREEVFRRSRFLVARHLSDAAGFLSLSMEVKTWAAGCRLGFAIFLFSMAISFAVFLGNSETNIFAFPGAGIRLNHFALWLSLAVAVLQLIPLLGLKSRSVAEAGDDDTLRWSNYFFNTAVRLAFWMLPFWAVHLMAREDISGFAKYRPADLMPADITRWNEFLAMLSDEELLGIGELTGRGNRSNILSFLVPDSRKATPAFAERAELTLLATRSDLRGQSAWERYNKRPVLSLSGSISSLRLLVHHLCPKSGGKEDDLTRWRHEQNEVNWYRSRVLHAVNQNLAETATSKHLMAKVVERAEHLKSDRPVKEEEKPYGHIDGIDEFFQDYESREPVAAAKLRSHWDQATDSGLQIFPRDESPKGLDESRNVNPDVIVGIDRLNWERDTVKEFNRLMLESLFPSVVRSRSYVSTYIVNSHDQQARWRWLCFFLPLASLLGLVLDFNRNAPFFNFYRDSIAAHFTEPFGTPDGPVELPALDTTASGMPYHLFNGALTTREHDGMQSQVKFLPFLFSRRYCGNEATHFVSTGLFAKRCTAKGKLPLTEAVTVSGSAFTPYALDNGMMAVTLAALNLRLGRMYYLARKLKDRRGLWRSPRWSSRFSNCFYGGPGWAMRVAMLFLRDRFFGNGGVGQQYVGFVADGGFRDFLGVEELIKRRCRLLLAVDAGSNKGQYELGALADMIRLARKEHGVEFLDLDQDEPIDTDRLLRDVQHNRVAQQFICCRVRYLNNVNAGRDAECVEGRAFGRSPDQGLFVYVQMSLNGKEETDLRQFRNSHPDFPDEPISNQFFNSNQVESYRQLGYAIGSKICRELPPSMDQAVAWNREHSLSTEQVANCIRLAYLWECWRESGLDGNDFRPSAILSEIAADTDFGFPTEFVDVNEPRLLTKEHKPTDAARLWLDIFETNADFRNYCRRVVFRIVHGKSSLTEFLPLRFEREFLRASDKNIPSIAGWFAVAALVCHELQYQRRPSMSRFQPGGRKRLIEAAGLFEKQINHQTIGHAPTLDVEARRIIAEPIGQFVFHEYGPEASTLLVRCCDLEWEDDIDANAIEGANVTDEEGRRGSCADSGSPTDTSSPHGPALPR